MTLTRIKLMSCDDSTTVDIELTEAQRALLVRIGKLTHEKADSSCAPVMYVVDPAEPGEDSDAQ